MLQRDYLLRMIQRLVSVLARAVGLRKKGLFEEARQELKSASDELLGLPLSSLHQLELGTLRTVLSTPEKRHAYLQLSEEEGELLRAQGLVHEADMIQQRVLRLKQLLYPKKN